MSAAVLTLAYPETAEWSSEIAGFKVFRIPLEDRPLMEGSAPVDPAVPDAHSARIPLSLPTSEARAEVVDPRGGVGGAERCESRMRGPDYHRGARDDAAGWREESAPASPNNEGPSVAIVVAGLEIKSVSDLTGKIIAIDDKYLNSHARIQAAIVSAGATDSLVTTGESMAIDRLLSGKAPAAVLTMVYIRKPGFR